VGLNAKEFAKNLYSLKKYLQEINKDLQTQNTNIKFEPIEPKT
jgi:hypothetical protein